MKMVAETVCMSHNFSTLRRTDFEMGNGKPCDHHKQLSTKPHRQKRIMSKSKTCVGEPVGGITQYVNHSASSSSQSAPHMVTLSSTRELLNTQLETYSLRTASRLSLQERRVQDGLSIN